MTKASPDYVAQIAINRNVNVAGRILFNKDILSSFSIKVLGIYTNDPGKTKFSKNMC